MKIGPVLKMIAGFVLASAGLWIFFRDVNYADLASEIRTTPWWVVLSCLILPFFSMWLRAVRWKIILPHSSLTKSRELFPVITISFMINNILPARIGEAARALILWRRFKYSPAESVGSLLVERLLDSLAFAGFFFVPILFGGAVQELRVFAMAVAAIFFGCLLCLILYRLFPDFLISYSAKLATLLPNKFQKKVTNIGKELISNLDWIFSLSVVVKILILSFIISSSYAVMIYALGWNLENFSFLDSLLAQAFAAMGAAIPLAPGYVGTLHAAMAKGLTMNGVDIQKAGAMVILYHSISYVAVTVAGLLFLIGSKFSFKEISAARDDFDAFDTRDGSER